VLLLLAGWLVFCHGCHGDDDSELCLPGWKETPPTDEGRTPAPFVAPRPSSGQN
jgi:hypothetical protein